jgi:hypothetical protein
MAESGINPSEISVDEQGRVIINNPILAAAIREKLASGGQTGSRLRAPGTNDSHCGNNC